MEKAWLGKHVEEREGRTGGACGGESRTGTSLDYDLQQIASTDLLLRGNLLKVPQPFKTMLKLGTKHSKYLSAENFSFKPQH